jgi:folate-binding protein YgfZ
MPQGLTATPIERDIVVVSGEDAASYLQTQLTQDVLSLPIGRSSWSYLLTPKAEIEAMVRVTHTVDGFVLDVPSGLGAAVRGRLDGPLFRMDVKFSQHTWPGIAWRGPGARDIVGDAPVVAALPWENAEGLDEVGPQVVPPTEVAALSRAELEAFRIRQVWPSDADLGESVTPAMTGIVAQTVSFDKGCYTGQEFVARVHYRDAAPPKRLVSITFEPGSEFDGVTDMVLGGETVGALTSVAPSAGIGLGYCKRSVSDGSRIMIGNVPVTVG